MRLFLAFCTLWLSWFSLVESDESKVVCYFGSWAVYRNGNGRIKISDIDPTLCTHMIYSFVGITEAGRVKVLDPWNDLADDYGKAGFNNFNALREKSQGTKTLVAIGGWNEGSLKYSKVMADKSLRSTFVQSAVDFTLTHGFDGFDLDWEYPSQRGGSSADVQNYVLLVKELRAAFDPHGLILTAAVAAAESSASLSYDISQMSKYLDFINLMTYDFHGSWETSTGHNAPLYAAKREITAADRGLNVNATINYWLSQGAPAEKLVLGTGLYGRTFALTDSTQNVPGSPANGPCIGGPYTQESGMFGYNEICEFLAKGTWTSAWDDEQHVPYAYSGNQWVSYDNVKSITEKAEYVKAMGLGGAMVWSVETDDFLGTCGDKFPLLKALNSVLRHGASDSASTSEELVSNEETTTSGSVSEPAKTTVSSENITDGSDDSANSVIDVTSEELVSNKETTTSGSVSEPAKTTVSSENITDGSDDSANSVIDVTSEELVSNKETTTSGSVSEPAKTTVSSENITEGSDDSTNSVIDVSDDSGQDANTICSGSDHTLVKDLQDCTKFWFCQKIDEENFMATSFSCSGNLYFDAENHICNYQSAVQC